jgi:acetyl esterase/lipase
VTRISNVAFTNTVDCGVAYCSLKLDIHEPQLTGTHPVAVLLPGSPGGPGHRAGLTPFAIALAKSGVLVFNADYRSMENAGPFPIPVDDAGCAVRFARAHSQEHGGDPSRLLLLGHSLGGYVALLEGLGAPAATRDCLATGPANVSAVMALEPPFHPEQNDQFWIDFMGGTIAQLPEQYAAADTLKYVGNDPTVAVRVAFGDDGEPGDSDRMLTTALAARGYDAAFLRLHGSDHFGGIDVNQAADQTIDFVTELFAGMGSPAPTASPKPSQAASASSR